jgi:hypothetical protein
MFEIVALTTQADALQFQKLAWELEPGATVLL